jgi:hypothetical protein
MKSKFSLVKSTVLAAALLAVVSGAAHADRLSESQFQAMSSEGPAWNPQQTVYDKAPSTFHVTNPNGLSERVMQSRSVWGEEFHLSRPIIDSARSEFSIERPHGLSESQLQAMSSEGPHWQGSTQAPNSASAAAHDAAFSINAAK